MPRSTADSRRPWGHAAVLVAAAMLVGSVFLLWAWNTIAVDLFQAPEAQFKHALALQAAIVALTALPVALARRQRDTPRA